MKLSGWLSSDAHPNGKSYGPTEWSKRREYEEFFRDLYFIPPTQSALLMGGRGANVERYRRKGRACEARSRRAAKT
jgi:hypothetical protein